MAKLIGLIGTYWSPKSEGVYRFIFDTVTGEITTPTLLFAAKNAKCVCLSGHLLAAPVEQDGRAGLALLDLSQQSAVPICQCLPELHTCCDIVLHDKLWYTANYHEGTVAVYQQSDTLSLVRRIEIGAGVGCHQVRFHQNILLVPCLELDEIRLFDTAHSLAPVGTLSFPKDAGPRHVLFNHAHNRLYVVTERSHVLFIYTVKGATFSILNRVPILNRAIAGAATAALRLSPDEGFLYVSTRGADIISTFRCTQDGAVCVQQAACGGQHPRDFVLSPDGRFVLVLNRDSNNLAVFSRAVQSGLLEGPVSEATVHCGSGILLAP